MAETLASETWNLWRLQGVISSHSAPLLYRDLNAKYSNNFLCVRTTFSLWHGSKEERKQSRRRKLERENEGKKEWTWNLELVMKMHPVQDLSTVIERKELKQGNFFYMRILTVETLGGNGILRNNENLRGCHCNCRVKVFEKLCANPGS